MKRTSNSGLYHIGKKTGNQGRLWERFSAGVRRRLAFRHLKSRADEGRDPEARFWLARLKLSHGQYERGWRILNELWFQGYRDEAYVTFLWKQAGASLAMPAAGSLNFFDHRVRWNLALYFWEREARDEVPGFIVGWLEQGWLGSMEFRILCDQVRDTGLLVKLAGVLTDHSAHNALLHILYRRLWALIQEGSSGVGPGEIRVLLTGLDYLPPGVWQFCFGCWQDRRGTEEQKCDDGQEGNDEQEKEGREDNRQGNDGQKEKDEQGNDEHKGNDALEDLLTDYFLQRRERGFFPLQALRELGKAKEQKGEKSLRAARLFNYLRLREFRSEEWNLALARCILPAELPPDPAWLKRAQDWTEMPAEDLLVLLGQVFRSGWRERELVVSLGMYLLNSPEHEQVREISGLAQELWKFREYLPGGELVRLGIVLAREMADSGKYEQALEIVEECLAVEFRGEELYLIGLKAALVLGKIQHAVALVEKAEGCLHREGVEKVRREAVLLAFSRGIVHPAFARAQLGELAGDNEAASTTVLTRYLLSSGQLSGEGLYCLRDIACKRYRDWRMGEGLAVKEPLGMVLLRQEGLTGWEAPGRSGDYAEKCWHPRTENPWDLAHSLQIFLNKLRTGNWEVMRQNRKAVDLAYKLWRSGVARREEMVLDFLVTAVELAEGELAELLGTLGEYCLEQGRVDRDASAVYRQVYRLRPDNLPNLYYLCKSLLSAEIALPPGSGYGANVLVWGSVFAGESKLPASVRPGAGPVVRVRRVFSERLAYKVQYFGGGEVVGEFFEEGLAAGTLSKEEVAEEGFAENKLPEKGLLAEALLAENVEIFVRAFHHFPNFLDNLVNLALLSPCVNLEEGLKLQVLERCHNLRELTEEALSVIRRELAKIMLKQENFIRVKELLMPCKTQREQGAGGKTPGLAQEARESKPEAGAAAPEDRDSKPETGAAPEDGEPASEASWLAPEALEALWAVGCQVALGLAAGEEALKALTGSESISRVLIEKTRRTGDGLV